MKKKIALLSVIAICLAIVSTATLAYFTSEDYAHNVITTNGINIKIIEKTKGEDGSLSDFPEDGIKGAMPGTAVSKIVSVQNTGGETAWIRVRVTQSLVNEQGETMPTVLTDGTPVMSFAVDAEKWILQDGWYYYSQPVDNKETTETLFEEVLFSPGMGNEYRYCTANLDVYAQAVQTDNNGETVLEAKGWPEVKDE